MKQKNATYWLLPAVVILLLHTFVPHAHGAIKNGQGLCVHHKHGFWELIEHFVTQDVGVEHLEHYHVSDVEISSENAEVIIALPTDFNFFETYFFEKKDKKNYPITHVNLPIHYFSKNYPLRAPPCLIS
jgi:hypothetical protein